MIPRTLHWLALVCALSLPLPAAQVTVPYSHGNPSDQEQAMLELINRARANPAAEGLFLASTKDTGAKQAIAYFKVDLTRLKNDFKGYPVRPPLAFNPGLLASSRRHSEDMAENIFQDHTGTDGSTILSRITYSDRIPSTLYAHLGFNIDWGLGGSYGVLAGVPHRLDIMNDSGPVYREIGIGIAARTSGDLAKIGKLAVTQDFGTRVASPDFLVGVAYYDVNNNAIFDPGEGIPGIKVLPSTGPFHAITSSSGGYAIPFAVSPGNALVTFSGGGLLAPQTSAFFINGTNAKADLRITSGAPFVYLKKVTSTTSESGGAARFQIVRVGPVAEPMEIKLTRPTLAAAGTALPKDYRISATSPARMTALTDSTANFTVTIPKNLASAEIKIQAVPDQKPEPPETLLLKLADGKAYRTGSPASLVISVTD
jgi:hypothetical protein